MKFGTMQSVLGEPLESVFPIAKGLGCDGVELDWRRFEEAKDGPLAPGQRPAIKAMAQAAGVEIASVAAHFLNAGGLAAPAPETQQFGLEAVREGIALCSDVGAAVLLVPFFGSGEIRGDDAAARLVENLKVLAPQAEAAGVTLGIEHALRGDAAAQILAQVGSPRVGDYWDMANCMSLGYDPLQEIEFLGGHIVQVHAKEYSGPQTAPGPGQYPGLNQQPFGQGDVPVAAILASLKRHGYAGYVVLETGSFGDPHGAARAALEVLKSV